MMRPRVSVVVVHYRAEGCLRRCLNELGSNKTSISVEVIVVDNASISDPDLWTKEYPGLDWTFRRSNDGFASAVNEGALLGRGEYVLVLNADAWPLDDCLAQLVAFLDGTPDAAAVTPTLVSPSGVPQVSGGSEPTLLGLALGKLRRLLPQGSQDRRAVAVEVDWASATALLCRRTAWDQIGGFDDAYFLYYEDCDLGVRLRRAGWRLFVLPSARAAHVGGASFRDQARLQRAAYRSGQDRYFRKYRPRMEHVVLTVLGRFYDAIVVLRQWRA
jgi:N-acetylglucosaminyl-diphospho-decaprenol L-rhamnosyltransferase